MRITEFMNRFPTEESCRIYFKEFRIKQGVICKKCQCTKHYWLKDKWQFQCSECSFRTGIRSGTIMENSRLPFKTWFLIFLFMSSTKKGISANELQKQVGHQRYQTIWSIMHRIRKLMGDRDDGYKLFDMVEFDEGYFEKATSKKNSKLNRGRGSQRQSKVAVLAESTPIEQIESGLKSRVCRYFKMKVLPTHHASEVNGLIQKTVDLNAVIFTDKSTSYYDLRNLLEFHVTEKSSYETTNETLKWVHIAISNAKRTMLGIYHKINGKYLQNYLNEFTYKLNRRYCKSIFERLVIAVTSPQLVN